MKTTISIKTSIIASVLIIVAYIMTGCGEKFHDVKLKNYITAYSVSRDFKVSAIGNEKIYTMGIKGGEIVFFDSKGKDLELFNEFAKKNMDTSYSEIVPDMKLGFKHRMFFSDQIAQIAVTCNKDIDEKHPAGSELNDLLLFFSVTPDKYIKNGYKASDIDRKKEIEKVDVRLRTHAEAVVAQLKMVPDIIYGTLSDIDFTKYNLIGGMQDYQSSFAIFGWITEPDNLSDYTLTVKIKFQDGVEKKATLQIP